MNITKQHYHYYHHQHHINSSATSNIHTQTLNVCWKHCVLCYPTLCMMQLCSPALTVDNSHEYAEWSICSLSLRSVSRRRSRLHECTPCRSIPSASPCRRQAKIERAQIVLDRSQPGLPGSSGSASPVFGRTPNAGFESLGMVLIGICTTEVTK